MTETLRETLQDLAEELRDKARKRRANTQDHDFFDTANGWDRDASKVEAVLRCIGK